MRFAITVGIVLAIRAYGARADDRHAADADAVVDVDGDALAASRGGTLRMSLGGARVAAPALDGQLAWLAAALLAGRRRPNARA